MFPFRQLRKKCSFKPLNCYYCFCINSIFCIASYAEVILLMLLSRIIRTCYVHKNIKHDNGDIINYITRNSDIPLFNHLPVCFKTNLKYRAFKNDLKSFLKTFVLYSLNDFFSCHFAFCLIFRYVYYLFQFFNYYYVYLNFHTCNDCPTCAIKLKGIKSLKTNQCNSISN